MKTIIGISEHNTCECCGKTNLKRTFIIFDNETGQHVYFGSDCARKELGKDKKQVAKELFHALQLKIDEIMQGGIKLFAAEKQARIEMGLPQFGVL